MAARHDHFHAIYFHDGQEQELEGGFWGYPENYAEMNDEEVMAYWYKLCVAWGMPKDAKIKQVWLAG